MLMVLEPGEAFEHAHREPSITVLVNGAVVLFVDGRRTVLEPDVEVRIAGHAHHTLLNEGTAPAVVRCVHIDVVR